MELYKQYPKLCTAWCCFEIVIYAGQMFGWSSLLFILKEEGFYANLCFDDLNTSNADGFTENGSVINNEINDSVTLTNDEPGTVPLISDVLNIGGNYSIPINNSIISSFNNQSQQTYSSYSIANLNNASHQVYNNINSNTNDIKSEVGSHVYQTGCSEQDSKLNLWFSVAICVSYITCAFLGPIMQKIGMRSFRLFFMAIYIIGALCLGFSTPVSPWLVCPGLCCVGVAGMALYSTNIQVSFLFPSLQSTITSIFVGLYDASTVVTQLVKLAYEFGISKKYSYIALSVFHVFLIGTSTLIFLPSIHIVPNVANRKERKKEKTDKENNTLERETFIETPAPAEPIPLFRALFNGQYILHVYWMCVQAIRFVTFLGFLNVWLQSKFNGDQVKESYFLSVFSYVTIGTAITAVTAGLLHDCQRRKYLGAGDYRRRRMPILLPLLVTTFLAILTSTLTLLQNDNVLYITFIMFTVYRSYLFSFEVTFINDIFPLVHFTVLFGLLHSSAGLAGMFQYPLFEWYEAYDTAPTHVNIFLICLELSSLIHPLYVWYRCRRHKKETTSFYLNKEIKI